MNTEEKAEPMSLDEKRIFQLANSPEMWDACMDFEEGRNLLQRNPLQRVGDRMRLIECLEKHGLTIIKTS